MNQLIRSLAGVCREQLLEEKWLIAPSLRVGHQWLESVARAGQPVVNCHVKTLKSLAVDLAAPVMARQGMIMASSRAGSILVDQAYRAVRGKSRYLATLEPSTGLAETILRSIDAVRLAGLGVKDLPSKSFEVVAKGDDLRLITETYQRLLRQAKLLDYAQVLQIARQRLVEDPTSLRSAAIVLVPADLDCSFLERSLLEALPAASHNTLPIDELATGRTQKERAETDLDLLHWFLEPGNAPRPAQDGSVRIVHAIGEVNEVRGVLRHCIAQGIPWDDVELLHTDSQTYVPLIYELLSSLGRDDENTELDSAVTFAEGIPCRYARPGRALLGWLRWMRDGFPQARLVEMFKEGLLHIPDAQGEHSGFARLARLLRGIGVGFGRERYVPKMVAQIKTLKHRLANVDSLAEADDSEQAGSIGRDVLQRDLADLKTLEDLLRGILAISPGPEAGAGVVIASALRFLEGFARSVSKLDRFAAQKLSDELRDMQHWLAIGDPDVALDAWKWLEEIPRSMNVTGSGPRPRCLHVDHVRQGGHSGRQHTFVVGLDDSRFPGAGLQDPLLLDSERRDLSPQIPTAAQRLGNTVQDFARLMARLRGKVTLSFAGRNILDDRELFPSHVLVSVFRLLSGNPQSDQDALLRSLPRPAAFSPTVAQECLDMSEWWLWRLTEPEPVQNPEALVYSQFPHLAHGRRALAQRASTAFTAFDGDVPQAGAYLDPTSEAGMVLSASRLQTLAACPRRFFFQYGLGIEPPDELAIDPERWLDALAFGSLLHELFDQFLRELASEKRGPDFKRDSNQLKYLLELLVARYKEKYPPPSDSAFERDCSRLEQTAEIFLRQEAQFCAETQCTPMFFEASLGMQPIGPGSRLDSLDPVPIELNSGKVIRVRGRIDRVDELGIPAAQTFGIWDYKTGSDWGYSQGDPFDQGRKIQPYLYVTIVAHRLRQQIGPQAQVAHFGFFFPGTRAAGQRFQWTPDQLQGGAEIVEHLCDLLRSGTFVATNNSDDCKWCDYRAVCGDVELVAAQTQSKLADVKNRNLRPFVHLRPIES